MFEETSKVGDKFECHIWSGNMAGIRIGKRNQKHFPKDTDNLRVEIDGKIYRFLPPRGFWINCPEIRRALDEQGKNYLTYWIKKNNLMSPNASRRFKGKEDKIVIEIVKPFQEYALKIR